jgi:hypothetical protein
MATSRATPPPSPTQKPDHVIWLRPEGPAMADPEGKPADEIQMKAGEKIQFSSKEGNIKVHCTKEWPFKGPEHEIDELEILTLKTGPKAKFECRIKPWGGKDFLGPYTGAEMKPR